MPVRTDVQRAHFIERIAIPIIAGDTGYIIRGSVNDIATACAEMLPASIPQALAAEIEAGQPAMIGLQQAVLVRTSP